MSGQEHGDMMMHRHNTQSGQSARTEGQCGSGVSFCETRY